jgi:hypothetical protein
VPAEELQHTTLATAHLRFLFVVAKIWKRSGLVGISYRDKYAERGLFQRLMKRLRDIATGPASFLPVLARPLTLEPVAGSSGLRSTLAQGKAQENLCAKLALNDGKWRATTGNDGQLSR